MLSNIISIYYLQLLPNGSGLFRDYTAPTYLTQFLINLVK